MRIYSISEKCIFNGSEEDLQRADLRDANLQGANLQGADLHGAKLPLYKLYPEEGIFIGWKKCYLKNDVLNYAIVKLLILDAKNVVGGLVGRKCRTDKIKVLEIINSKGKSMKQTTVYSLYNNNFSYTVGKIVKCSDFDNDIRIECSSGIHFFMTKQEAIDFEF